MITLSNWRERMGEDLKLRDFRPRTQESSLLARPRSSVAMPLLGGRRVVRLKCRCSRDLVPNRELRSKLPESRGHRDGARSRGDSGSCAASTGAVRARQGVESVARCSAKSPADNRCTEFAIEQVGCGRSIPLPPLVDGEVLHLGLGRDDSGRHLSSHARGQHLSDRPAPPGLD
jgi:hypothetical protein